MILMSQDFDFNEEFENDADVEEALDNLITEIACAAQIADNKTRIVNPIKMQQLLCTLKILKYITKGSGVKVTYELYKPFKSMGSVTVCGKNITFTKPEWFAKVVDFVSNFEVYPKTDGTTEMNFTFHGLTVPIED